MQLHHGVAVTEGIGGETQAASLASKVASRRIAREYLTWHLRHGPRQASTALCRRQVRRALRRREDVGEPSLGVVVVNLHLTGGEPRLRDARRVISGGLEEPNHEPVEPAGEGGGHYGVADAKEGLLHRVVRGGQEVEVGEAHVAAVGVHAHVHVERAGELGVR